MQISPLQRFIASSGMTNLADGVATVAWAWLASLLTRDALLIALVPIALRLPWFLFALPAGIITDRVDRRRLIIAMDILRALAFGGATIAIILALPIGAPAKTGVSDPVLFATILSAALIVGVAEVFRDNAAQTMLPALVDHAHLESANGRLWSVELIGNALIGPALGAFLIAAFLPLPFALNAFAMAAAVLLVSQISGTFKPNQEASPNWRRELREGYDFLRNAPLLKSLALLTGFWNLFFHVMAIALVLHVQENLDLGARAYGLILAAGAVGGVLGGLAAQRIIAALGPGRTAQIMLGATPVSFLGIALAPGPWSLALMLAVFEFSGLVWNTVSVSYRQRVIPDVLLGRVNSIYRLLAWGMIPIGLGLSGLIVRISETMMTRQSALIAPFYVALIGATVLAILGWRVLGKGFADANS